MEQSITTSVRLPLSVKKRLDSLAHQQHRKKNQLIVQALQEYLQRYPPQDLTAEAMRQCGLANQADTVPDEWDALAEETWTET